MKRVFIGFVLVLALCVSPAAFAADGLYGSVQLGPSWLMDSKLTDTSGLGFDEDAAFETGFATTGAIGFKLGMARVEGEISYRRNGFDEIRSMGTATSVSGDITALSGMLNGYFEMEVQEGLTPFVMAGVGVSNVSLDDVTVEVDPPVPPVPVPDQDDTVFAYQVGAGAGFALTEHVMLDLAYRYFATLDPEFTDSEVKAETGGHNFMLGVRVFFFLMP